MLEQICEWVITVLHALPLDWIFLAALAVLTVHVITILRTWKERFIASCIFILAWAVLGSMTYDAMNNFKISQRIERRR